MLAKCVNPACPKPLHYLRDGRIFHVERSSPLSEGGKQSHNVEHFWLCGECCQSMTVLFDPEHGVRVVPRWQRPKSRAA